MGKVVHALVQDQDFEVRFEWGDNIVSTTTQIFKISEFDHWLINSVWGLVPTI